MCKNECIATHNTLWDVITTIVLKSGTLERKVSHLFPPHTPHQINILITKGTFQMLPDIIIIHLTYLNMVQCASTMTSHIATVIAQKKTWSYTKRWLHSPSHKDLWLSSLLFQFSFYYLCSCHYNSSLEPF